MFRSRLLAAALASLRARRRVAGAGAGAVLQGQAAHGADQLRRRLGDRHRGPRVRAALRQAHRRPAATHRAEHRRRRRHQRHALSRRGRAQGRHDHGLHHRHRLELRQPAAASSASTSGPTSSSATRAAPRSTTCAPTCRPASSSRPIIVKAQGLVSGGVAATTGRDLSIRLDARHARRAVQARHRLSQRRARAARAAAERDPSLCGHARPAIAARSSRRW